MLFRRATRSDLPAIVRMLADDQLGSQRETYREPLPASYYTAFEQIDADPNHELLVRYGWIKDSKSVRSARS